MILSSKKINKYVYYCPRVVHWCNVADCILWVKYLKIERFTYNYERINKIAWFSDIQAQVISKYTWLRFVYNSKNFFRWFTARIFILLDLFDCIMDSKRKQPIKLDTSVVHSKAHFLLVSFYFLILILVVLVLVVLMLGLFMLDLFILVLFLWVLFTFVFFTFISFTCVLSTTALYVPVLLRLSILRLFPVDLFPIFLPLPRYFRFVPILFDVIYRPNYSRAI